MNIIFFSRYFYPHIGGVEKHVYKVASILSQQHTVSVITEQYDTDLPLVDYVDGITIYRLPCTVESKQKKYEIWNYLFAHRSILEAADVIHIHDVFYWYLPFRFIYPNKRVYMTFHGYEGNSLPGKKAILSHKIAEVLSKGNICIGDYLQKWYGTKPTIVSYGATDILKPVKKQTSKKRNIRILYIGRLEEEAGILEYLALLNRLTKQHIDVTLTVLGDGSLRKKAERYVSSHNLHVKFEGFVPDVEQYIPDYDVIFTSRFLGTIEALAARKPVFCIYNNAIKRDCFLMAPFVNAIYISDDVGELAQMFVRMLDDRREVKRKIEEGYSWVKNKTWQHMADHYTNLWEK